ncbi:MAG: DHA2 family efflux MFS transporter permease subunit [Gaiellaceae bacterium MAG52_C11]|nr:DHA2 family efflux MFS transporter permease subunit [Candidatus Gaiellasilicea maunaloa]
MEPARARTLTLVATILGSGIALLDGTIVNVALPAIQDDLGGGLAGQQWVVNAYLLTLGSLILVGGSLGDLYGERRIFALGVAGFGVASVLCAIAPTIETLVAARAIQGVTSALLTPASLALIATTFEDEKERGAAIGTWTAWGGIAAVIGPVAGGQIVDVASWRWIFGVNVPLVAVTLALIFFAVERGEAVERTGRRIDIVGAVLTALGLAGPVFALVEQPQRGWTSPVVLGGLVGGAILLAAFVVWERRTRDPMLPLGLLRRRNFSFTNVETLLVYAGLSSLFFFLTIFLQTVAGYSALESGLAGLPVTIFLFFLSGRIGALSGRFGPRLFMGTGPLVAAAGVLLLVRVDESVSYFVDLLPPMIVFGLGLALTVAPLTSTVMAEARRGDSGIASGVNNAVARVAGLLGIAVVGVAVAGRSGAELDLAGFRLGMVLTAVLVGVGGVVGLLGIRNPELASDEEPVVSSAS